MDVSKFVATVFNNRLPFRVEAYDGSSAEPSVASSANFQYRFAIAGAGTFGDRPSSSSSR